MVVVILEVIVCHMMGAVTLLFVYSLSRNVKINVTEKIKNRLLKQPGIQLGVKNSDIFWIDKKLNLGIKQSENAVQFPMILC